MRRRGLAKSFWRFFFSNIWRPLWLMIVVSKLSSSVCHGTWANSVFGYLNSKNNWTIISENQCSKSYTDRIIEENCYLKFNPCTWSYHMDHFAGMFHYTWTMPMDFCFYEKKFLQLPKNWEILKKLPHVSLSKAIQCVSWLISLLFKLYSNNKCSIIIFGKMRMNWERER